MIDYCDFLAGTFAGVCNMFISHPLDTVKTNMQSYNMRFITAAKTVVKEEGIRGCYRGFLFPLVSNGFFNSIVFGVYGNSFRAFQQCTNDEEKNQKYWFHHVFLAGCCGGVIKAAAACPIELTKVRLQVRTNNATGPIMVIKHLLETEGIKGIFKGFTAMQCRDAIPYGLFMLVYEYLLEKQHQHLMPDGKHVKFAKLDPVATAISGAVAGMASWIPAVPFDVIKTRMMTETNPKRFRNIFHCFSVVISESGVQSLFRGGTVLILRSAPICAVSFLGYEFMLRHCREKHLDS